MKIIKIIILLTFLTGCANYNVRINGINPNLFKERNYLKVFTGVASSFVVHELGHLAVGNLYGNSHFDFNKYVVMKEGLSYSENQMFYRAGFLGQLLVGGGLTLIKSTRHSDFTFGFNSFTTINTAIYTISGGSREEYSDIENLDNGELEGIIYTGIAGILTYENIKEEK